MFIIITFIFIIITLILIIIITIFIRVVSTVQIQHTESYRCVLRASGIKKQVLQPHIVSKTIAANRFDSYRFVSVSVGVCFEGLFGGQKGGSQLLLCWWLPGTGGAGKVFERLLRRDPLWRNGKPRKQTETASSRFHVEHFPGLKIVFEGSHFSGLIRDSCNQPSLTRRVRSFLRVPTSQGSSGTARF